jgi:putative toxin-antitoxin system antitoxin component (TIGR02293 family)
MSVSATAKPLSPRPIQRGARSFLEFRAAIDQRVLAVFASKAIQRSLREEGKVNLEVLWQRTAKVLAGLKQTAGTPALDQWDVHRSIVEGLPGEALYIASAMAFDSMQDALPFFDVSAKTARLRIGESLPANQGEIALRIGRVLTMAGDLFGSLDVARSYLRTPNFALGGAVPRDLLKTAEGEQLVLAELQTQAAGGPV